MNEPKPAVPWSPELEALEDMKKRSEVVSTTNATEPRPSRQVVDSWIQHALYEEPTRIQKRKASPNKRTPSLMYRFKGTVAIYALIDPRSEQIYYIGQSNDPLSRALQHFSSALHDQSAKSKWIMDLRREGLRPVALVLQEVQRAWADTAETGWIARCRSEGMPLVNCASVIKKINIELDHEMHAALVKLDLETDLTQSVEDRFAAIIRRLIVDATKVM